MSEGFGSLGNLLKVRSFFEGYVWFTLGYYPTGWAEIQGGGE
jgi:hypothetical protein